MKYYRVAADGSPRLAVRTADTAYDPTSAKAELTSFLDLLRAASITDRGIDEVTDRNRRGRRRDRRRYPGERYRRTRRA